MIHSMIADVQRIPELLEAMERCCHDDNRKDWMTYDSASVLLEATHLLDLYNEKGSYLNECCRGWYGTDEQINQRRQKSQLIRFIKKYSEYMSLKPSH